MSAHGYTFRFSPTADGRVQRLVLVDTRAICRVCRNIELYRAFEVAPFHSMTLARLGRLPREFRAAYDRPCGACGEALTGSEVVEVIVTFGMASGEGVIEARLDGDVSTFMVISWRKFDPQLLPRWSSETGDEAALTRLDEGSVRALLGRYLSTKQVIRDEIVRGGVRRLTGRGIVVTRGLSPGDVPASDLVVSVLAREGELARGYPAAPEEWLGDLRETIGDDTIEAWVSIEAVERALIDVLGEIPMPLRAFRDRRDETVRVVVPSASTLEEAPVLDLRGIALEAARTACEPGDIARLEVERMLWFRSGIWGEEFSDASIARGDLRVDDAQLEELKIEREDDHHDHDTPETA